MKDDEHRYISDFRQRDEDENKDKHWNKCCKHCAYRRDARNAFIGKDGRYVSRMDNSIAHYNFNTSEPFVCCHREDTDGKLRVCAGWDAKHNKNRHK